MAAQRRPPVSCGLDPAQTAAFLNSIRGHRLYAAYHLIALRGLRRGEACGLRWCDIDLDAATAVISWQLQQYGGHVTLRPPKTAHSERIIALDRTTVAVPRAHIARQQLECAEAGDRYHDSGYVLTGLHGDPLAPDRLSRCFRQLADSAGLPPIRLHDLRHGAASLARKAGGGHESGPDAAAPFVAGDHGRHLHLRVRRGDRRCRGEDVSDRAAQSRRSWSVRDCQAPIGLPWADECPRIGGRIKVVPCQDQWGVRGSNPEPTD